MSIHRKRIAEQHKLLFHPVARPAAVRSRKTTYTEILSNKKKKSEFPVSVKTTYIIQFIRAECLFVFFILTIVRFIDLRVIRVHTESSRPSFLPAAGPSVQVRGTLQKSPPTDENAPTSTEGVESNAASRPVQTFQTIFDRLAKPKNPLKKVERKSYTSKTLSWVSRVQTLVEKSSHTCTLHTRVKCATNQKSRAVNSVWSLRTFKFWRGASFPFSFSVTLFLAEGVRAVLHVIPQKDRQSAVRLSRFLNFWLFFE